MTKIRTVLAVSACLWLVACDFYRHNLNINGALPVVPDDTSVTKVDLIAALVPPLSVSTFSRRHPECLVARTVAQGGVETNPSLTVEQTRICVQAAFNAFGEDVAGDQQARRNEIVGRLRMASEMSCAEFTQHLNSIQAHGNLWTGILATGLAGAGAIFTPVNTTRALAGSAAVVSGARAEFNADIFFKEAAPVIVNAVKAQRTQMREELDKTLTKTIKDYPISNAIADAFRYNDTCSLVEGLAAANQSITLAQNPGLEMLNKALLQSNLTRLIINDPRLVDSVVIKSDGTGNSAALTALGGARSGSAVSPGSATFPLSAYQSALDGIIGVSNGLKAALVQATKDPLAGSAVSDAIAKVPAPAFSQRLDLIVANGSARLAATCQALAVAAQAAVSDARWNLANSTAADKTYLQLDVRLKQSVADRLGSAIVQYQESIASILLVVQRDIATAVGVYAASAKADSDKTTLSTALATAAASITTLSNNLATAGAIPQPGCA